jgi:hypothetical protein
MISPSAASEKTATTRLLTANAITQTTWACRSFDPRARISASNFSMRSADVACGPA